IRLHRVARRAAPEPRALFRLAAMADIAQGATACGEAGRRGPLLAPAGLSTTLLLRPDARAGRAAVRLVLRRKPLSRTDGALAGPQCRAAGTEAARARHVRLLGGGDPGASGAGDRGGGGCARN